MIKLVFYTIKKKKNLKYLLKTYKVIGFFFFQCFNNNKKLICYYYFGKQSIVINSEFPVIFLALEFLTPTSICHCLNFWSSTPRRVIYWKRYKIKKAFTYVNDFTYYLFTYLLHIYLFKLYKTMMSVNCFSLLLTFFFHKHRIQIKSLHGHLIYLSFQ